MYSKGPWKIELRMGHAAVGTRQVISSDTLAEDGRIAVVSSHGVSTVEESQANAHLIASAPDLLEACKQSLIGLEYCFANHVLDALDKDAVIANMNQLKAAIAKAEGKE